MKTKIFVCSSSGIDYISHSENISSIPVIVKFSNEEKYQDYFDINNEILYTRLNMDKSAKPTLLFQTHHKIKEYVDKAYDAGYEQVLILIADKQFSNLEIAISIALADEKRLSCHVYNTLSSGFPLAIMALEANEMLTKGASMDEVYAKLTYIRNNSKILYFIPSYNNETSSKFAKKYNEGKIVEVTDEKMIEIEVPKALAFNKMIELLKEGMIGNKEVIPFMLYPTKSTKYIELFGDSLIEEHHRFKKMKYYPLPSANSVVVGANVICLGYVVK